MAHNSMFCVANDVSQNCGLREACFKLKSEARPLAGDESIVGRVPIELSLDPIRPERDGH